MVWNMSAVVDCGAIKAWRISGKGSGQSIKNIDLAGGYR